MTWRTSTLSMPMPNAMVHITTQRGAWLVPKEDLVWTFVLHLYVCPQGETLLNLVESRMDLRVTTHAHRVHKCP